MKAIVLSKYGNPENVLHLEEVEKPNPGPDEVLVKIVATAVNDYEWAMVTGRPRLYQIIFGLGKPKWKIPGMEFSGIVESVGDGVSAFKTGDQVYGDKSEFGFGTFAEYAAINQKALRLKPSHMSFEEATSIPHASMLAYQALFDTENIKDGKKILINGGGGGVGFFGLQLAKQFDVEVTGVDTGDKLHMMKEMGFDYVIDFKKEDFTRNGQRYDLILDAKTTRSPFKIASSLNTHGIYATVGGTPGRLLQTSIFRHLINRFSSKKVSIVMLKPNKDLAQIEKLFEEKKIRCIIDGPYKFEEIPRLVQYFGKGKHTGKIVVKVSD